MRLLGLLLMFLSATLLRAESPAEMKPYTEAIPGTDVKFEMLPIPGGTFTMGSPAGEAGRAADEGPAHPVEVKALWIGKTEVTWDEYDVFAFQMDIKKRKEQNLTPLPDTEKAADAVTRPTPPYVDMTFGKGHTGNPAICMTHHAAMEYTRWLSAKTGKTYRLLTEAEWEYACRAGSKSAFSFGDDPKELGDYAWFTGNSNNGPKKVAQKKPNAWGLCDMHGNVSEWVLDHYKKDFFAQFGQDKAALQPVLLPDEKEYSYVSKGGSWDDKPVDLRSAVRKASDDNYSLQDPQFPQSVWWHTDALQVGFRVCRPLEEQENLKGLKSPIKGAPR